MTYLDLPPESRAEQLFERLEAAFRNYQETLPAGLSELARQQGTYYGDSSTARFASLRKLNPVLVAAPWLFWESFHGMEDGPFLQGSEAGAYLVLSTVVLDHLVDGQAPEPGMSALYHQALYSRAFALYRSLFPAQSPFWGHFDRLAAEHLAGLAAEIAVQVRPEEYDHQTLAVIAYGKFAPIVTVLAGLCAASGQMGIFPAFEASIKHSAVASQLLDDIGDWQADAQNRHLTCFLALFVPPEAWRQNQPLDGEQLQRALDAGWLDVQELKRARRELQLAIEAVRGLDCPAWVTYLERYQALADEHLEGFILRHLSMALHPS